MDMALQGAQNPNFNSSASAGTSGSLDPTINSSNLSPSTTINPVQPSPSPIPNVDTSTYTTATTLGANEQQASDLTKQIEALNTSLTGKSAYQTQQNTAAGVDQIQQAINDNTTAINQLQNSANQAKITAENRQVPTFAITGEQAQIARQNSFQALGLASISDALKNNLVAAQTKANAAVTAKYGQQEADLAAKTANLNLILKDPATTLEEKNRANAQLDIQNAKAADLAQQKADSAAVLQVAHDAAQNAANFKPITVDGAYYPTLSSALNGIATAKTPADAQRIQIITGLIPKPVSTNKTQIIGGETTGYTAVTTDASGKVISTTPVKSGAVKPTTTPTAQTYKFTPTVKSQLLGAGNTTATISQLQSDIAAHGAQYVLDNGKMDAKTQQAIETAFGITKTQPAGQKKSGLFGLGFWGL